MKKIYCKKCGREIKIKFGKIPDRCSCGAEFDDEKDGNRKELIRYFLFLAVFMAPFFFLIYVVRGYLEESNLLYFFALAEVVVWFRVSESAAVCLGLMRKRNIERK